MTSGYAAPIVELDEGSKNIYKLNQKELEKTLGRADIVGKKIALISIAGAYRKGKSFMLNLFVTYLEHLHKGGKGEWFDETTTLDKFNWRGGTKRDTNGIFIWSVPYILEDQNGEEVAIFLMDTQGTFDHQSTVQDCATIFALSTLLSSVQIYNISTQIQEDDLNNLRLFTEYAQLTKDENRQHAPFQKLLFLVRDWTNSDEYEYGYEGGKEYLKEEVLKTTPEQKKELKTLRESIKSSFESLKAFLMPHPGLRIARNNSEKVLGKIEEEFSEQLDILVPSLFKGDSLKAKKIDGKEITCREMVGLFEELMKIFNSDDLPEPKTILEATADAVNLAAEQRAREAYDKYMKEVTLGITKFTSSLADISTLLSLHQAAETQAFGVFSARPKLGEKSAAEANKNKLKEYIKTRYEEHEEKVKQNILIEAEREAEKTYDKHMKENFVSSLTDISTLLSLHEAAKTQALAIFSAKLKLDEESAAKVNNENLNNHFETRHEEYKSTVQQNIRIEEVNSKIKEVEDKNARTEAEREAREAYDTHMQENSVFSLADISTLLNLHQAAETQALRVFSAKLKPVEESAAKANKDNLTNYFATRYKGYKKIVERNIRMGT
ncbi:hypothetical protein WR25_26899 isoform A [Diploscapter pachys]|uniref:GB1/RHD3-type G domain-containing protein n=1 Tax=Diploscapter pachys TaxID=2018661 RepID=A0A2A2JSG9_9BILA|nr:hypothetical protein WR25_26899 isoform A [Diploscapter pachys]